jgi:hypothetical protein
VDDEQVGVGRMVRERAPGGEQCAEPAAARRPRHVGYLKGRPGRDPAMPEWRDICDVVAGVE